MSSVASDSKVLWWQGIEVDEAIGVVFVEVVVELALLSVSRCARCAGLSQMVSRLPLTSTMPYLSVRSRTVRAIIMEVEDVYELQHIIHKHETHS